MSKRNEPCPCGSGKKYKKCCYLTQSSAVTEFSQELKDLLQGQNFDSLNDVQDFLDDYVVERSSQGVDDFHGLSSDDMHQLLYQPFGASQVVKFTPSELPDLSHVPVVYLTLELAKSMNVGGLKPTAKGNIPQKVVKQIYQAYSQVIKKPKYDFSINKEDDFYDLNVARHLMMMSGLIRKYDGKFVTSKKMKHYLSEYQAGNEQCLNDIYFALFKSFCTEFNWAYSSYNENYDFIQQSFAFSLYLLSCYGNNYKHTNVYGDYFIDAFPNLLLDIEESYCSPEDNIKHCYRLWVFKQFAHYFGLAKIQYTANDTGYFTEIEVKATPLLKAFVHFSDKYSVFKGCFGKH